MSNTTETILKDALALAPAERAALVSELLTSLDRPDARIDEMWVQESVQRLAEYDAGRMQTIPVEAVFEDMEQS